MVGSILLLLGVEYPNNTILVAFRNFSVTPGLADALDKAVADNGSYTGTRSGGAYTLKLRVR